MVLVRKLAIVQQKQQRDNVNKQYLSNITNQSFLLIMLLCSETADNIFGNVNVSIDERKPEFYKGRPLVKERLFNTTGECVGQ